MGAGRRRTDSFVPHPGAPAHWSRHLGRAPRHSHCGTSVRPCYVHGWRFEYFVKCAAVATEHRGLIDPPVLAVPITRRCEPPVSRFRGFGAQFDADLRACVSCGYRRCGARHCQLTSFLLSHLTSEQARLRPSPRVWLFPSESRLGVAAVAVGWALEGLRPLWQRNVTQVAW
jgi:hypothetical protein